VAAFPRRGGFGQWQEQVEANIAASGLVLDAEIWTKAENILAGKKETE